MKDAKATTVVLEYKSAARTDVDIPARTRLELLVSPNEGRWASASRCATETTRVRRIGHIAALMGVVTRVKLEIYAKYHHV